MSPAPPRARAGATPLETATRRAVMARDAGLRRINAVTRWTLAGALALSGVLALVASGAFHGRSTPATTNGGVNQAPQNPGGGFGQPPGVPQQSAAEPLAVSGGS